MKRIHYFLLLMPALLAAACEERQKPVDLTGDKKEAAGEGMNPYETGVISAKPLSSYVKLPGQLKPYEEVEIYGRVNGFVDQVLVDRGSRVTKGQVLVKLQAPEMESQLQAAISKYVQAQENAAASKEKYRRLKEAAKEEGAVAPLDLDNALSRMKADEAIVMSEKSNVASMTNVQGYLTITAPFNGVIVQRNISAGALVGPGSKSNDQPMLVLQHLERLRLEVFIPEAYVDKVDLERSVNFEYNSMPGRTHSARISRSANALSTMRSEAIEIDIQNKYLQLKPGMYAEVKIPLLSGAKSMLVPNHAIVRSTERHYIVSVKNGATNYVDIKEGLSTNDSTEIFGELNAGDTIILHATDEIMPGIRIK